MASVHSLPTATLAIMFVVSYIGAPPLKLVPSVHVSVHLTSNACAPELTVTRLSTTGEVGGGGSEGGEGGEGGDKGGEGGEDGSKGGGGATSATVTIQLPQ